MSKQRRNNQYHLDLINVKPITKNQELVFENWFEKNLIITGSAGTGKSYISLYLSLRDIMDYKNYEKLIIIRSALPARNIGFLKGTDKEKVAVYELPYQCICSELFLRGDAYDVLTNKRLVEFMSTSYLRGLTFDNSVVLVDEIQNATASELNTVMTRMGKNSKIILCGDILQSDPDTQPGKHSFTKFLDVVKGMDEFFSINFTTEDIVRSGLVKNYIIRKEKMGVEL